MLMNKPNEQAILDELKKLKNLTYNEDDWELTYPEKGLNLEVVPKSFRYRKALYDHRKTGNSFPGSELIGCVRSLVPTATINEAADVLPLLDGHYIEVGRDFSEKDIPSELERLQESVELILDKFQLLLFN